MISSLSLTYNVLPSNVHEFMFHDVHRNTLDQFFGQIGEIMGSTPPQGSIKLLIHISAMPSVQYMISHSKALREKFPQKVQSRVAVVYADSGYLYFMNMAARALNHSSTLRLFPKNQHDQAHVWLSQS